MESRKIFFENKKGIDGRECRFDFFLLFDSMRSEST